MSAWFEAILVSAATTIREAFARIEAGAIQLAVVVDDERRLVGLVTDGDLRRGLLRGLTLESSIETCINRSPLVAQARTSDSELLSMMRAAQVHQVPLVDANRRVVDVKVLDAILKARLRPNLVVLMVGGKGTRLGDLTRDMPKPMLPVGGRPILEAIISNFCAQGFRRFALAVNYRREIIQDHFQDGARLDCKIEYLIEESELGTAGALGLLSAQDEPVIVSNGDLIHNLDFGALLDYHVSQQAAATMAVRQFENQIPFGVVKVEDGRITGLEEKPITRCLIAGGLYVLEPAVLSELDGKARLDMPELFNRLVSFGAKAAAFPIEGYWLDIGRPAEYERAQQDAEALLRPAS